MKNGKKHGFTLIELMIVVLIVAIIATVGFRLIGGSRAESQSDPTQGVYVDDNAHNR